MRQKQTLKGENMNRTYINTILEREVIEYRPVELILPVYNPIRQDIITPDRDLGYDGLVMSLDPFTTPKDRNKQEERIRKEQEIVNRTGFDKRWKQVWNQEKYRWEWKRRRFWDNE